MITKRIDYRIRIVRCFGLKLYLLKKFNALWRYNKHPNRVTWWQWEKRCKETYNWLIKHYGYVIQRHKNDHIDQTNIGIPRRIWTMWWQGEENAPEIVKMCISSMRMNFDGEVIVLTKNNYREYVEIPEHILLKLDQGKMSLTHFSDIIRMNLLRKWGGCWLDATILMVDGISSDVFAMKYYTAKLQRNRIENISYNEFSGFLLFEVQDGLLSSFASDFFSEYWKNEDYLIDYFWFTTGSIALQGKVFYAPERFRAKGPGNDNMAITGRSSHMPGTSPLEGFSSSCVSLTGAANHLCDQGR